MATMAAEGALLCRKGVRKQRPSFNVEPFIGKVPSSLWTISELLRRGWSQQFCNAVQVYNARQKGCEEEVDH